MSAFDPKRTFVLCCYNCRGERSSWAGKSGLASFPKRISNGFETGWRQELTPCARFSLPANARTPVRSSAWSSKLWLIDHNFFPAPHNQSFLERLADPSVVAELSQFNIEINAPVERIDGRCFQRMHAHLSDTMRRCATNAHEDVDTVIAIGTLPTLRQQDLSLDAMTPSHRYYALNREAMRLRGGMPLEYRYRCRAPGAHHFLACFQDVMLEAAATSFQLHLQVPPAIVSRTYNASVILSAPLVAIAPTPPSCSARRYGRKRGFAIFEQSLQQTHGLERVTLGTGYAGDDITELFEENRGTIRSCSRSRPETRSDAIPACVSTTARSGAGYGRLWVSIRTARRMSGSSSACCRRGRV